MSMQKPTPFDADAEESVLGSLLIDPQAINMVRSLVQPGDFFREKNGWVFDACLAIDDRFEGIDQVTVAHELAKQNRLEACGGVAYLSRLVALTPTSVHAGDYAEIVKRCAFNRRLIQAGQRIFELGYENNEANRALGQAQEWILALAGLTSGEGPKSIKQVLIEHRSEWDSWLAEPKAAGGLSTGYQQIDNTIGGFEVGSFYVLAARTSMGKTQMAANLTANVAGNGVGVVVFTPEMREFRWALRMVLAKARVNRYAARLGQESRGWQDRAEKAYQEVGNLPIWIDDTSAITTGTVHARTAILRARFPQIGMLVFDYANLAGDDPNKEERQRVTNVSRRLQAMAKALAVAVLGVYQLNRGPEGRDDKRPKLSDLRESGVIEETADAVFGLYRPAYYKKAKEQLPPNEENLLEFWILKQRDGASGGAIKLFFDVKTGFIGELAMEEQYAK